MYMYICNKSATHLKERPEVVLVRRLARDADELRAERHGQVADHSGGGAHQLVGHVVRMARRLSNLEEEHTLYIDIDIDTCFNVCLCTY